VGSDRERQQFVRGLFDRSAAEYDRICRLMALGLGDSYRREALVRAGLGRGMRMLDVATGTGLVAEAALSLVGADGRVVGIDPSSGMLRESKRVGHRTVQATGEALPFVSGHFDVVGMGYALRHLSDLETAFAEYWRVLKRGGSMVILEITRGESTAGRWLTRQYLQRVVPLMTRVVTRSADGEALMKYYWDTIADCVEPEAILSAMRSSGFIAVERRTIRPVFSEYVGTKR
jgi:demethylmenaquinone methyltransferase/2-methoxy-6-polyprenyl-1,4-benzoquinol methylase